jgi:hypothetical protein
MTKVKIPQGSRKLPRGRTGIRSKVAVIRRYLQRYLGIDTAMLTSKWMELFDHYVKHKGLLRATEMGSKWYNLSLRLAANVSYEAIPFVQSDKTGFPRVLLPFKPYLTNKDINCRRAALTVLQLYKLYDSKGKYSLESITSPSTGSKQVDQKFMDNFEFVCKQWFPAEYLSNRIYTLRSGFHLSGSNGPNGPSLGSAYVDREAIRGNIEVNVAKLAKATGNDLLSRLLQQSRAEMKPEHGSKVPCHSRIRVKYESGGKARNFAIIDWFSQSALKSIHQVLMSYLGSLDYDGTSSHSRAAKVVQNLTNQSIPIWSFDLTKATDRWPLSLISIVMEHCFGKDIADAWTSVISDRTFEGPNGEQVRWSVGQPLGALSSWASFAITHHIFIQTCERMDWLGDSLRPSRKKRNRRPNTYYHIIGDDVVIHRYAGIALMYKKYLQHFGIEISIPKSITPEQCLNDTNSAEMAKRVFSNGLEITPVPPEAIIQYSQPYGERALLECTLDRGYLNALSPYTVQSVPRTIGEWRLLTFPFRNALAQLNGVKTLFPYWTEDSNDAPAGLNPNWFYWYSKPEDSLKSFTVDYILREINQAESATRKILADLKSDSLVSQEKLKRVGGWQPGPTQCHPIILQTVLQYVSKELMHMSFSWGDPNMKDEDLYKEIGKFHLFLEPNLMIYGRKAMDQKGLTRLKMSRIVKFCERSFARLEYQIRTNTYGEYDKDWNEPESSPFGGV